jgi:outer membrane protein assembly factor BamB
VLVDGLLFFATDTGVAFCIDVDKRSVAWRQKLGGRFFSSAVAQGDSVIFADESGKVSVVARDRTFKLIAQIEMGEKIYASPVPQADGLLIRGTTNLFYLKARPANQQQTGSLTDSN